MVVKEFIEDNKYIHTYSDLHKKIKQLSTGDIYDDAVDMVEYPQEYEETDIDIPTDEGK